MFVPDARRDRSLFSARFRSSLAWFLLGSRPIVTRFATGSRLDFFQIWLVTLLFLARPLPCFSSTLAWFSPSSHPVLHQLSPVSWLVLVRFVHASCSAYTAYFSVGNRPVLAPCWFKTAPMPEPTTTHTRTNVVCGGYWCRIGWHRLLQGNCGTGWLPGIRQTGYSALVDGGLLKHVEIYNWKVVAVGADSTIPSQ